MATLGETTLHRSFILSDDVAREICDGWISDKNKMQSLSVSDNRPVDEIIKDVATGMAGEWSSYLYVSGYGVLCRKPQCGVMPRDAGIWGKDLISLKSFQIRRCSEELRTVSQSMSCKTQLLSQARKFGASWTFQLETPDRNEDPMLKDPFCNKILIVSLVDNYLNGKEVGFSVLRIAHDKGFRWRLHTACFWWPDVFDYLSPPKKEDLRDKKICLYFDDIEHLQSRIVAEDDLYDF